MTDVRRDGLGTADEDRLPWLEPVEEEPIDDGVSAGRLIAGLVVALIVLGLVVGGIYWLKQRATGGSDAGAPGEIAAAPGPYKTKPVQPGGMQPKGQGDSSYAASEGADVNGQIDLAATPETPIARKPAPVATPPATQVAAAALRPTAPAPAIKPATPPSPTPPAAAPAVGGAQVQLGAFSSQAKAEAAWKSLSGRFATLTPLGHTVAPVESNGKTVYRLRAAAGNQASAICGKLKVAGETCLVVG